MVSATNSPNREVFLACPYWQVDGFLARRFKMGSVLGTILDPAADKALMTTLTVTLAVKGMLPGQPSLIFSKKISN